MTRDGDGDGDGAVARALRAVARDDLELADDNATVLWMRRPLLSAHGHVLPGPQYARWARPAADRLRAVLGRSVIRDDLCATHAALCSDEAPG